MQFFNNLLLAIKKHNRGITIFSFLFIFCFFYFYNITGWLIHDDEGGYLYQAWRMSEGAIPYTDFYSPKEPLFLFTGSIIFKLFGPDIFWARIFTAIITILTGYLIFLIGRRIYSYKVSLWALVFYLILPVVYFQARRYCPDAYAVFFSTLGLFLFIKAWQDNRKLFFAYSGISYAVSLGYKLPTTIGITAILIFIFYQAVAEKRPRIISQALIPFISGFLMVIIVLLILFNKTSPLLLTCIVKHQLSQPLLLPSNLIATMINNIKEFLMIGPRQYGLRDGHPWLIIFSLPLAIRYLFVSKEIKKIFTFYIFSVCLILLTPYDNQILRYLLYIVPVVVLLFVSSFFSLFRRKRNVLTKVCGVLILMFILIKVIIPGLRKDSVLFSAEENGTSLLANYIRKNTQEADYVMVDYGDILFHVRRKTTPLMAGMSASAVVNGVITSDRLIKELEDYQVKMVFIHREGGIPKDLSFFFGTPYEPHHFSTLINSKDGPKFMDYLWRNYLLAGTFNRTGQIFDIYYKKQASKGIGQDIVTPLSQKRSIDIE